MPQLTENFSLSEFTRSAKADELGIINTPTPEHLENLRFTASKLEVVRGLLCSVVHITSGYRNPVLNKEVGGVPNSAHALGLAADFVSPGFGTPFECFKEITRSGMTFDQLIYEDDGRSQWVHIGFSDVMRNQCLIYKGGVYSVYKSS